MPRVYRPRFIRPRFMTPRFYTDIKDIAHKEDFRNGTFVTLKQKYFS